jgi:alkanesulfonate monooxygenase SsuD/methylene tetrahydromethanopterin reductase-like flavin-dependent oxidoreductase (luciferase family)
MGVTRHVVVAQTEREALEVARPAYRKWRESFLILWLMHGSALPNPNALPSESFEEAERAGRAVAGTADKVFSILRAGIDEGGLNYLLCRFLFGDMHRDAALQSVRLFAREVMPAFAH